MNNNNNNNFPNTQIFRQDGKNCFVEITTVAFAIDKVTITFVSYDATKPAGSRETGKISIYLNLMQASRIAHDVLSGRYAAIAKVNRAKAEKSGSQYPEAVMTPIMGGTSAKKTKDNVPVSRQMKLSPGASMPWVLEALQGPGKEMGKGLITPAYSKPDKAVRIGLTDDGLKEFALALQYAVNIYMQAKHVPVATQMLQETLPSGEAEGSRNVLHESNVS